MLKTSSTRLAATTLLALGVATATAITTVGPAAAATTAAASTTSTAVSSATVHPDYAYTTNVIEDTKFYPRSGGTALALYQGDAIEVTCYYEDTDGETRDGYWDHVVWSNRYGSVQGHVDDYDVDLGGETPPQFGIPHC